MGARKKPGPTASASHDAVKVKRVIFKRRKVLKGVRMLKPPAEDRARAKTKRTWQVKKLDNGLVDVSNTPPWLLEV